MVRFICIVFILASCSGNVPKETVEESTPVTITPSSEKATDASPEVDSLSKADNEKSDGAMVYVTHDGDKYHTADCRYSKAAHTVTLKQAKADGKTACDLCKPNSVTGDKQIRCSAKTADGTRCKRMTTNKSGKCFQHTKS
jgi:hypothetical protein